MKTLITILIGLFLMSAAVVTTTQIVQPKQPIDIKMLRGEDLDRFEKLVKTYIKVGYVIKESHYMPSSFYPYLIILEKY